MRSLESSYLLAALLLVGSAGCGSGSAGADPATTAGGWRLESPLPTGYALNGVWGSSASDVWAVGDAGTIVHWNGAVWATVASGTKKDLKAIWGSGASNVWAVGVAGTILHWNGSAWTAETSPTTNPLAAIWGSGANDVWAVGADVLRWNGSEWTAKLEAPAGTGVVVNGVWGSGPDDVWCMEGASEAFLHWDGAGVHHRGQRRRQLPLRDLWHERNRHLGGGQ